MNYALKVLKKHQLTIEVNLKGTNAIQTNTTLMPEWKKQLKEIKTAIAFLEVREKIKHKDY